MPDPARCTVSLAKEYLTLYFVMDLHTVAGAVGLAFCLKMVSSDSRATKPNSEQPDSLHPNSGEPNSGEKDTWQKDLLEWRAKHATDLQKPDGWLSLAGLEWLQPGDNSVGWHPTRTPLA